MATEDLLSLADAKDVLRIGSSDTTRDTLLTSAITSISHLIESHVGYVVTRTVTNELHDGGRPSIRLHHAPTSTITTVTEAVGATTTNLTAESFGSAGTYLAETGSDGAYTGRLWRRKNFDTIVWEPGRANVRVTYDAGRVANTAAVDGTRFAEAARICLLNWWQSNIESVGEFDEFDVPRVGFPRFAVPHAARDLLADQWRPAVA